MDSESDELLLRPKTTRDKDLEISLQDYSREKIEELCKTSSDLTADKVLETWIRELMKFKELRSTEDGDLRNSGYRNSVGVTRDSAYSSDVEDSVSDSLNKTECWKEKHQTFMQQPLRKSSSAFILSLKGTELKSVEEERKPPDSSGKESKSSISLLASGADKTVESSQSQKSMTLAGLHTIPSLPSFPDHWQSKSVALYDPSLASNLATSPIPEPLVDPLKSVGSGSPPVSPNESLENRDSQIPVAVIKDQFLLKVSAKNSCCYFKLKPSDILDQASGTHTGEVQAVEEQNDNTSEVKFDWTPEKILEYSVNNVSKHSSEENNSSSASALEMTDIETFALKLVEKTDADSHHKTN